MSDLSDNPAPYSGAGGHSEAPGSITERAANAGGETAAQAAATARDVRDRTSAAADAAMTQAGDRVSALAASAVDAAATAGEKLRSTIDDQKRAGADQVDLVSRVVHGAADGLEAEMPQVADYIRRAAAQIETVADALRRRDLNDLVSDVQDFARRHPTAFLGATALAGFAAVRFLKTSGARAAASSGASGDPSGMSWRSGTSAGPGPSTARNSQFPTGSSGAYQAGSGISPK